MHVGLSSAVGLQIYCSVCDYNKKLWCRWTARRALSVVTTN